MSAEPEGNSLEEVLAAARAYAKANPDDHFLDAALHALDEALEEITTSESNYWRDIHGIEAERDAAEQALFDVTERLGFDNDGDKTPAALIAGMGRKGFIDCVLREVAECRKDYDDAQDEASKIVDKIRALHQPTPADAPDAGFCKECDAIWPCSTFEATKAVRS